MFTVETTLVGQSWVVNATTRERVVGPFVTDEAAYAEMVRMNDEFRG